MITGWGVSHRIKPDDEGRYVVFFDSMNGLPLCKGRKFRSRGDMPLPNFDPYTNPDHERIANKSCFLMRYAQLLDLGFHSETEYRQAVAVTG